MPASAHPPIEVNLQFSNGVLSVEIYHPSATPDTHYIESVEVYVNDDLQIEETYTSQPANSLTEPFTYEYNVTAHAGDTIEAIATCNQFGSNNGTLIVPSGQQELDVDIDASASQVESNGELTITIKVESDSEPVEEASVTPKSDNGGSFTDVEDKGNGEYTTTFTAPEVISDTTLTITVKAERSGYTSGEDTVEITVTPAADDDDDDDDNGSPGFGGSLTILVLVGVVLILVFNRHHRKR
jgi:desulfoferrodoxin (superoxide reductase-like protein)